MKGGKHESHLYEVLSENSDTLKEFIQKTSQNLKNQSTDLDKRLDKIQILQKSLFESIEEIKFEISERRDAIRIFENQDLILTTNQNVFSVLKQDIDLTKKTKKFQELTKDFLKVLNENSGRNLKIIKGDVIKDLSIQGINDEFKVSSIIEDAIQEYEDIDNGELICRFERLQAVAPRGKYSIDLTKKFMKFTGGTHEFIVLYKNIIQMYLLPKPNSTQLYLTIMLDIPFTFNRTPFFHIVLCFDKNEIIDANNPININLKKEEIEKEYPQKGISPKMNGGVFEIVSKVIRALSRKKIFGYGSYRSFYGSSGFKCIYKSAEGYLYFIEKTVIFLYQQFLLFKYDEIQKIKIHRSANQVAKFFGLEFTLKSTNYVFSCINNEEEVLITQFLSSKNLTIENQEKVSSTPKDKKKKMKMDL